MKNILVVEDEIQLCEMLAEYLSELGYTPYTSTTGEEALTILDTKPIDLIISDMRMPNMNGIDLLKSVKASRNNDIPIIIMSGYEPSAIQQKIIDQKADEFLMKPFTLKKLTETINKLDAKKPTS